MRDALHEAFTLLSRDKPAELVRREIAKMSREEIIDEIQWHLHWTDPRPLVRRLLEQTLQQELIAMCRDARTAALLKRDLELDALGNAA